MEYDDEDDGGDWSLHWVYRLQTHFSLIWVFVAVIHDGHQGQPGLLGGGEDLLGWQQEAVQAGVPQLEGVGVLDALVVGPVDGATAGLVCVLFKQTQIQV